jgi:hypothetical protein
MYKWVVLCLFCLASISSTVAQTSATIDYDPDVVFIPHHHPAPPPSPLPTSAKTCTLPPESSYNPYNYQAGFSLDNHTYNPYTTTLTPYSGDPEPNANIYHEPKKPGDDPGHWARGDYKVTGWGSDKLWLDADVSATVIDGKGNPSNYGGFIAITNSGKAPIYFGLTTSVLNDKVLPGERVVRNLMVEQPKNGPEHLVEPTINVKFWVSEGVGTDPHCKSYMEYYRALDAMPLLAFTELEKKLPWTYKGGFSVASGKTGTYVSRFPGGYIEVVETPENSTFHYVNESSKPIFLDNSCTFTTGWSYIAIGPGLDRESSTSASGPPGTHVWDGGSCSYSVLAPPN